jgi:hypothetical protein
LVALDVPSRVSQERVGPDPVGNNDWTTTASEPETRGVAATSFAGSAERATGVDDPEGNPTHEKS